MSRGNALRTGEGTMQPDCYFARSMNVGKTAILRIETSITLSGSRNLL